MNSSKKIFLFDMDGTLTPPRGRIQSNVIRALRELSEYGKIGIVTGSDYDYVWQQMSSAFDVGGIPVESVDILPCNGTKRYTPTESRIFKLEHEADMIEEIGRENYNSILRLCSGWQWQIMTKFDELPYTGTFLQYRGSLLNWCPIGRSADSEARNKWVELDNYHEVRELYAKLLSEMMKTLNIQATAALGGSTSLDIYPEGWDKTYALRHYKGAEVYFAGDKCDLGGNDWHLYEKLKSSKKSFKVESTDDTVRLINKLIETNSG